MKWFDCAGIIGVMLFAAPSYAYARGGEEIGGLITSLLIGILVCGVIFLILREVVCWYWKINQQIALLSEIRDTLMNIAGNKKKPLQVKMIDKKAEEKKVVVSEGRWICPSCDEPNMENYDLCSNCGQKVVKEQG